MTRSSRFDHDALAPARASSVLLCLCAAALLTLGGLSKAWLANGGARSSLSYGLLTYIECRDDACWRSSNQLAPAALRDRHPPETVSPVFAIAGWITTGASALAIVALSACALLGAFRRRLALPIAPATLALLGLLVALLAGCAFLAFKPGGLGRVGVDRGFILFAVGVVLGMVAAQRISAVIRPLDPDLAEHDLMSLDRL
jgi:hypothetical protein